jgi:hypothetical protein
VVKSCNLAPLSEARTAPGAKSNNPRVDRAGEEERLAAVVEKI